MRDVERLKTTNVYSHTQLVIQFSDGIQIKVNFLLQETIQTVIEEMQQHVLLADASLPPFQLYITPPRQRLEPTKTLLDLGLVPAAKIYVSWKEPLQVPLKVGGVAWFIRPELVQPSNGSVVLPAMPTSLPVMENETTKEEDKEAAAAAKDTPNKRKKTKADKVASLLARMMRK